ncbi:MAG: M48 family metallopeptidase [Candidatus Xenobia bacterium]
MRKLALLILLLSLPALAALIQLSPTQLRDMSNEMVNRLSRQYGPVVPITSGRTARIFARLVAVAQRRDVTWQPLLVPSSEINAEALPDGRVVFYRGLLQSCDRLPESALAFAAGHEISHVEHRDVDRKVSTLVEAEAGAILLFGTRNLTHLLLGQVAAQFLTSGYSREVESQADIGGLEMMQRAHFDPRGARTLLALLASKEKGGARVFPSHPLTADRINNVNYWLAQHGYH